MTSGALSLRIATQSAGTAVMANDELGLRMVMAAISTSLATVKGFEKVIELLPLTVVVLASRKDGAKANEVEPIPSISASKAITFKVFDFVGREMLRKEAALVLRSNFLEIADKSWLSKLQNFLRLVISPR